MQTQAIFHMSMSLTKAAFNRNSFEFYLVSLILLEFFDIKAAIAGAHLVARAMHAFSHRASIMLRLTLVLTSGIRN